MIGLPGRTISLAVLALLAGCGPDYSPNTYSTTAVQQANKVERGEVIGVRQIDVTAAGLTGAATGAAAGGALGGVAGSETPGSGLGTALGAIGGGLVGGILGTTVEHAASDTTAFEYIVRKTNNDLVSVTQKDAVPLKIGTKVLVIGGNQARIVPDYTVDLTPPKAAATTPAAAEPAATATPAAASAPAANPPATAAAAESRGGLLDPALDAEVRM